MVEDVRFPTLSAYLRSLPRGLDSYPECRSKGALVRSILDDADLAEVAHALPRELASLVRERPPITAWVPAVHADAIFHLHCDVHARDDGAMLTWTYDRTARVGRSQAYRHLLTVAGPRMLLRTGVKLHGLFQQGTDLEIPELEQGRAVLLLKHPPHLHSRLNQLSNVALLRALVDLTGGRETHVEMVQQTPSHARYEARWR